MKNGKYIRNKVLFYNFVYNDFINNKVLFLIILIMKFKLVKYLNFKIIVIMIFK